MIEIIKLVHNDDSSGSTNVEAMVCSSIQSAEEIILEAVNKEFSAKWKSLKDAAFELGDDLTYCIWDKENKSFAWYDNGKGETYIIGDINTKEVDTTFQIIGNID